MWVNVAPNSKLMFGAVLIAGQPVIFPLLAAIDHKEVPKTLFAKGPTRHLGSLAN
jgi:hypothetical protein